MIKSHGKEVILTEEWISQHLLCRKHLILLSNVNFRVISSSRLCGDSYLRAPLAATRYYSREFAKGFICIGWLCFETIAHHWRTVSAFLRRSYMAGMRDGWSDLLASAIFVDSQCFLVSSDYSYLAGCSFVDS